MTAELPRLPDAISTLMDALKKEGYTLEESIGEGVVNRVIELRHLACRVRISADRGQWWIELGPSTFDDLFDPDVWLACLDGQTIPVEPSAVELQAAFVRSRWRETTQAAKIEPCLRRVRAARARERLGLPNTENDER